MGLTFTGVETKYIGGVSYQAKGDDGKSIAVKVSDEVLTDYGVERAKDAAGRKYSDKEFEADGSIKVHKADCSA